MQIPFSYFIFLFFIKITACFSQVAYDPHSIIGWNAMAFYDGYVLAPYDVILDVANNQSLPAKFRSPKFLKPAKEIKINLLGFNDLKISGSGQFSRDQLVELVKYLNKRHHLRLENIIIVDLREEGHGFINGDAVTFFYGPLTVQQNKLYNEVIVSDYRYLRSVKAHPYTICNIITKGEDRMPSNKLAKLIAVKTAYSEQELSKELGVGYVRLPVTDHFHPDNNDVDQFLEIFSRLKLSDWLHFKCRGGKGRTTTFMAMYDVLKNPQVSLEDIIKRQTLIHGIDLAKGASQVKKMWKSKMAADRVSFLKNFYDYVHAKDGYGKKKWREWAAIHLPGQVDESYETYIE